jgi:hypothetical protein
MKNNLNTIEETRKLIKQNLYDEELEDDDPFFFNVKFDENNDVILGNYLFDWFLFL